MNINEITVENQNQFESTQTTENTLSAVQTTQNTLNANQTTENTLGANQTIDQLGSSQSSDSMLGMNETGSEMTETNDSLTVPSTDGEYESNPVDYLSTLFLFQFCSHRLILFLDFIRKMFCSVSTSYFFNFVY